MALLSECLAPPFIGRIGVQRHLLAAIAAVAVADQLFYDAPIGLSLVLAFAALAILTLLANPILWSWNSSRITAGLVLTAALVPGLENPGALSLIFAISGTAIFCLLVHGHLPDGGRTGTLRVVTLLCTGPFRLFADLAMLRRACARASKAANQVPWSVWFVPLVLGAVFFTLFVSANPLIENWFQDIDIDLLVPDPVRLLIWLMAIVFVWPFIRVRVRRVAMFKRPKGTAAPDAAQLGPPAIADRKPTANLFGPASILRSLFLFNAMFAVQTILDLTYLWGGVTLPEGMNYAIYAHRGAYPLIATALLAAGFVLAAMRPGSETEGMPLVRRLVYLWTGQNVLLVISAILRLNLYVEIYSLTMLRIAALIWMMLVALGLTLIVMRIALGRSNRWLISLNAAALAATLYVCSFVNFPHLIASYNVDHCRELSGKGVALDRRYVLRLGPQAIPALDAYAEAITSRNHSAPLRFMPDIERLATQHDRQMADWRGWSFRGWRLTRYLRDRRSKSSFKDTYGAWSYRRNPF